MGVHVVGASQEANALQDLGHPCKRSTGQSRQESRLSPANESDHQVVRHFLLHPGVLHKLPRGPHHDDANRHVEKTKPSRSMMALARPLKGAIHDVDTDVFIECDQAGAPKNTVAEKRYHWISKPGVGTITARSARWRCWQQMRHVASTRMLATWPEQARQRIHPTDVCVHLSLNRRVRRLVGTAWSNGRRCGRTSAADEAKT